jgi:hypothetical protein
MLKRVGPKRISRLFVRNENSALDWRYVTENGTIRGHKLVGSASPDHSINEGKIVRNEPITGN